MSNELTHTTTHLLIGLFDQNNRDAWGEFDRRYRAILIGFLRRTGLNADDAADVAQETLACFVRDYRAGKYQRERGRLRTWLLGIARCRLLDLRRADRRRRDREEQADLDDLPSLADLDALWEVEQRRAVLCEALTELRLATHLHDRTIEAFERVVLRGESVQAVATDLGYSAQEIYGAKNRVVDKLRQIVQRYDDDSVAPS